MSIEVIGIGSLNYDYIYRVDGIATGDSQVVIRSASGTPGGSAANSIYWLSQLNINTSFIGTLGSDYEGKIIIKQMKVAGIDISNIIINTNMPTSKVLVFVDPTGERAMYSQPGASLAVEFSKKQLGILKSSKFVIISAIPGSAQFDKIKDAAEKIHKNTSLVFMPGALYTGLGLKKLDEILPFIDTLILNHRELKKLTGLEYKAGAKKIIHIGCKTIVITLGKMGCYILNQYKNNGSSSGMVVPSAYLDKDQIVDSTGAGDAFTAGLVYGLLNGKNNEQAALYGNLIARWCLSSLGARGGNINKLKLEDEFERYSKELLI